MKTFKLTAVLSICCIFFACEQDNRKSTYSTLGNIELNTDSLIINSDLGNRLLASSNNVGIDIENGDRVLAYFTEKEKPEQPAYIDYVIDIVQIKKVLFKDIVNMNSTENLEDSIGNDPIEIDEIWYSNNVLNLSFHYLGGYMKHYINLVTYDTVADSIAQLEIRHNSYNDAGSTWLSGFVSFDLTSLQVSSEDSIKVMIKAKEFNGYDFEDDFYYSY